MKLGIVIPTYRKLDGSTYYHLKRALESVKNQIHKDYKVFLIGDNYTDNEELMELSKIIDDDKIYLINLKTAEEREKYSGIDLWRVGGVNASNIGIKKALEENIYYICHLDHDDYYFNNHLILISECIEKTNTNFITTKCGSYPDIESKSYYIDYRPIQSKLFKVSTCVNYNYFSLFFRNTIEETGKSYASDADLWNRINEFLSYKNEWGVLINEITCEKLGGKTPITNPDIVK